jgi:hypothetical protein
MFVATVKVGYFGPRNLSFRSRCTRNSYSTRHSRSEWSHGRAFGRQANCTKLLPESPVVTLRSRRSGLVRQLTSRMGVAAEVYRRSQKHSLQ